MSPGYQLAPEFTFPAACTDCLGVARHIADTIADFGGGVLAVAAERRAVDTSNQQLGRWPVPERSRRGRLRP